MFFSFLFFFLPSLHDYEVKVPIFTFCGGRDHETKIFLFVLWTQIQSFKFQLLKKIANIWQIKRVAIRAMKFKAVRIHLFGWRFRCSRRRRYLSSLLGNLSTGRFRGNGNFSDRKSLGRKQRRSRQNINVKQQTKFAAATSIANSVRC